MDHRDSHSPTFQHNLAPGTVQAFRPVNINHTHEPEETGLERSPTGQQPGQQSSPETQSRATRTPLPSGPRLERTAQAVISLPSIDIFRSQLQSATSKIISNPNRSRYSAVRALLLHWDNEQLTEVKDVVDELGSVLNEHYDYMYEADAIPLQSSRGWLLQRLIEFMRENDHRDVLKIVYYNGHTYLDENRCMILADSKEPKEACEIRWSSIQHLFEEAVSDTLVIMDAPYFGLPEAIRKRGVLEILAAGSFEEHASPLGRCAFTRALIHKLRTQAPRPKPFSAAELHAQLVSEYPRIIQDLTPDRAFLTKFPAPLHMQLSGSNNVPSILLAPLRRQCSWPKLEDLSSPDMQLCMTFQLDKDPNMEQWLDWLRLMPDGVKEIKVEGPSRSHFS